MQSLPTCDKCGRKGPHHLMGWHYAVCDVLGCLPRGWDTKHPEFKELWKCVKQMKPMNQETADQLKQSFTDAENHFGEAVGSPVSQLVDVFLEK